MVSSEIIHATKPLKALHTVSAWASEHHLVLAQQRVESKSNEITAIPELLNLLDIQGAVITLDAMGTQRDIASQIIDQGGDYILALKGNQGKLHKGVETFRYWSVTNRLETARPAQ